MCNSFITECMQAAIWRSGKYESCLPIIAVAMVSQLLSSSSFLHGSVTSLDFLLLDKGKTLSSHKERPYELATGDDL